MTRIFAYLALVLTLLAGISPVRAMSDEDFFNFSGRGRQQAPTMQRGVPYYGPGSDYFGGGSGPIPRTQVSAPVAMAPGTIYISTSERRLYLILGNGAALSYGIGVGRDGFRWTG